MAQNNRERLWFISLFIFLPHSPLSILKAGFLYNSSLCPPYLPQYLAYTWYQCILVGQIHSWSIPLQGVVIPFGSSFQSLCPTVLWKLLACLQRIQIFLYYNFHLLILIWDFDLNVARCGPDFFFTFYTRLGDKYT